MIARAAALYCGGKLIALGVKLAQLSDDFPLEEVTSSRVDEEEADGPTYPVEMDPEAEAMLREGRQPSFTRTREPEPPPLEGSLRARRGAQRSST